MPEVVEVVDHRPLVEPSMVVALGTHTLGLPVVPDSQEVAAAGGVHHQVMASAAQADPEFLLSDIWYKTIGD